MLKLPFHKHSKIILVTALIIVNLIVFVGLGLYYLSTVRLPRSFTHNILDQKIRTTTNSTPVSSASSKNTATNSANTAQINYTPQTSGYQLRVPILLYHYISANPNPADHQRDNLSTSPDIFRDQMKYLSEHGYTSISLDTLYAILHHQESLPAKPIIITADDGYEDFYTNAYPILRQFNIRATVFIPTSLMDQGYYLKWPQIQEMQNSQLINFGSHLVHHINIAGLPPASAMYELTESKKILQDYLHVPINFLAFPYGTTSNEAINLAQRAGFVGAVGTWFGFSQSENTMYDMPRIKINSSYNLSRFASMFP